MGKPSAAFTHDELCDEFDWMYEFNSRMAERIRNDPDVHNLVAYVEKLEGQNKELREFARDMMRYYFMPSAIDSKQRETELIERARRLGVEKDDGKLGVEVGK